MARDGEKRTNTVNLSVSDSMMLGLSRLAAKDDRALAEYIERVLDFHVNGHGIRVQRIEDLEQQSRGD